MWTTSDVRARAERLREAVDNNARGDRHAERSLSPAHLKDEPSGVGWRGDPAMEWPEADIAVPEPEARGQHERRLWSRRSQCGRQRGLDER